MATSPSRPSEAKFPGRGAAEVQRVEVQQAGTVAEVQQVRTVEEVQQAGRWRMCSGRDP